MSTEFQFNTTPSIRCGAGATAQIGAIMRGLGCRKVAFVTDPLILELGLAQAALDGLRDEGVATWIFSEVVADPPEAMILAGVKAAREEGVDGVVCVGGGSSMDTAKLIAVLLGSDQTLSAMYGVGQVAGRRVPLVLAPTTAGTGSEVTPISIVTTGASEKKGVVAPQLLPDVAILDATLTTGLPVAVTAATGIDAMVHAIEAFTSVRLKNIVSDCLAKQALALLGAHIRTACFEPDNLDAREAMLMGSMLAGMAFANAPVAAVHALAYPLGGHFHVPHGLSNALVLPHVLRFNAAEADALYAELAPIIFEGAKTTDQMIAAFEALGPELGMTTQLRDVGVSEDDLSMLATDAMKQERLLINNPRAMTYEAARAIYAAAL